MKILFTLLDLPENPIDRESGLYIDLAKECARLGHDITIVGSSLIKTRISTEAGINVLRIKAKRIIGQPNLIKKGIAMATLPYYFKKVFYKYCRHSSFDWIVLPTPPITLIDFVVGLKRKTGAKLYLILRDIHPQSSWSLGVLRYRWMYNYLDSKSRRGYEVSNLIGCMSQRNIDYILEEYPELSSGRMRILLNWMQPAKEPGSIVDIREKYSLEDKILALFGGNIGLGQRVENIVDLADHYRNNDNVKFIVIGKGICKERLKEQVNSHRLDNILFFDFMPQEEYLNFVKNVDIGLISIHENNAAPTCPSKLASYMSMKIPVLAMINRNNDYGQMIDEANAGFWAVGSDKELIYSFFDKLVASPELRKTMGESGYEFFINNMTTEIAANTMLHQMETYNAD